MLYAQSTRLRENEYIIIYTGVFFFSHTDYCNVVIRLHYIHYMQCAGLTMTVTWKREAIFKMSSHYVYFYPMLIAMDNIHA